MRHGYRSVVVKSVFLIVLGASLAVIGVSMRSAKNISTMQVEHDGTKGRNAAIGAGVSAVGGGVLAAVLGGVGIVVAGTGIGLPAGALLIGSAAVLGAGGGAIAGAATGTNGWTENVTVVTSAYETWQCVSVLLVAAVLMFLGIFELRSLGPIASG